MKLSHILTALLAVLVLASCAHQPDIAGFARLAGADVPGFWRGLVHGCIAPVAFVVGLFSDVRIYAFPNSGSWYDFGFLLGLGVWGGGAAARR